MPNQTESPQTPTEADQAPLLPKIDDKRGPKGWRRRSQEIPHHKKRLYHLFGLVEKEFENIYAENLTLRAKIEVLTEKLAEGGTLQNTDELLGTFTAAEVKQTKKSYQMGQKLKTALRVPPSGRLVNTFKVGGGGDAARCRFVHYFEGHKDGVWHVDSCFSGNRILVGSASADQSSRIWDSETADCLVQYLGHQGSVNCIRFKGTPENQGTENVILATASGDRSAHIWTANVNRRSAKKPITSDDEIDGQHQVSEREDCDDHPQQPTVIRTPTMRLTGHSGVVIGVDWLLGGKMDQVITASWDRTANIYDATRGDVITILSGHDAELTSCSAHQQQKLVVTSSKDTTFRLYDFREPIHSVAVFQGHNDSVTSAIFSTGDKVISSSDDRMVKVWDLRNMRSALSTIRMDSPVNRLSICHGPDIMAIPTDNRHVRLYDLSGNRLARLPRHNRRCHRKMICAASFVSPAGGTSGSGSPFNLFTCAFDRLIIGWKVALQAEV